MTTWLTISQVSDHFGVSRATVEAWIKRDLIKSKNIARNKSGRKRWRFHPDWITEFESQPDAKPRTSTRRKMAPPALRVVRY